MWGSPEEPPGTMEADPPELVEDLKDTCDQTKSPLESVKDIMLRNKQTLKKKEEELQKYAKRLSKYKTRAKKPRSSKVSEMSSTESTPSSVPDTDIVEPVDDTDDISQATTPKAKSSLLQKKLAEDRKIFQQRSKELTESKRAVEEKVEALRQQFEEKLVTPVSIVSPVPVISPIPLIHQSSVSEIGLGQDKDNKIAELSNKIYELEAIIIDLQDNLKEKDSVIDSKTKAITLMTADLSKKGKTVLDNLEDTKDEMRLMQENFLLIESSLRSKIDNLLRQLEEKTEQSTTLEENVQSLTDKLEAQKQAETVNADFSRSTMDTLVDTKDAMKSMQENFILIETSLKSKNEHLLKQLEEREIKLAEAEAKILHLEAGMGIEKQPNIEDLSYKVEKLEETNRNLEDEKYELQKLIAGLQDKIISNENKDDSNLVVEKDNRITEMEGIIKELKTSNQLMEESKMDLEKQIDDLNKKNEELSDKVNDLEKQVVDLEKEKSTIISEAEAPKTNDKEQKLIKELDDLNKSMIKMKVEHKNKLKALRKQINSFKKVSDSNAEIVKLGNQVALLEEEKGNLQLSLVDFDELKASTGDSQQLISDLEGKVSAQAKEIQAHIEAIAILENQKLDSIQELHMAKQEISSLEAENAESENLRVTAEMKVVDLEEELESVQRRMSAEPLSDTERLDLQRQIESLVQDNERLTQKIGKLEELKSSSEVGSTDSFVKMGSNVDSTESFEALAADADRAELLKRIDGLTRENGALLEKLTRYEEKGSSDTGSTESFERIPEAGEEATNIESLTRKNFELAAKVAKLEKKLAAQQSEYVPEVQQAQPLLEEPSDQVQKSEKSISLAATAAVLLEGLTGDWESDDLQKPIEENDADSVNKAVASICTKEPSADEEEQRRKYESSQALIHEQKITIQELRAKLEDEKAELVADLRSKLEIMEEELRVAIVERDRWRDELEIVSKHEQALVEKLDNTYKNMVHQGSQLSAFAEEQKLLVDRLAEREALVGQLEAKFEFETKPLRERLEEEERKVADLLEDKRGQEEARGSVERQLLNLEASYEESMQHATNVSEELRQAYKSLELLKLKHMEDMDMLNRRLEDVIEELQLRTQENASLESELAEKSKALEKSVTEEVKVKLETELAQMQEKAQTQLDKLKKYAAVAKKKTVHCEELEAKLVDLEEKWTLEKGEKETRNMELHECMLSIQTKDNKIIDMEEQLQHLETDRDEALRELEKFKVQLIEAVEKDNKIADLKKELQHLDTSRNDALREIEIMTKEVTLAKQKDVKIAELGEIVQQLEISRNETIRELHVVRAELISAAEKDNKIAEMTESLQRLQNAKDEALLEVSMIKEMLSDVGQKDNRIMELEEELQHLKVDRDQAVQELAIAKKELNETTEQIGRFADVQEELERIRVDRDQAFHKIELNLDEIGKKDQQIADIEHMLHRYETGQESCDEINRLKAELKEALEKENTILSLSNELKDMELAKEEALHEVEMMRIQLVELKQKDWMIEDLKKELSSLESARNIALHNIEVVNAELNEAKITLNSLSEAKDEARELGVRMQVMEAEYVEQLSQINSLRAENGLLLSKQAQVNERLENVEKESEERRAQLEKLEKEQLIAETQRSEAADGICGSCTTRLQALEAMLQERDAEIENLDNELHNSIGNLMQMQEHLRMSTVPSAPVHDGTGQESYDELARRYNTLMAHSEETRIKYEATLRHNEDLLGRVSQIQSLNDELQVRLEANERDSNLARSSDQDHDSILAQGFEQSRSSEEESMMADGWGLDTSTLLIDSEIQQQESVNETEERQKREAPPPLFDASVFGPLLSQPEGKIDLGLKIEELKKQVALANEQLAKERTTEALLKEELEKLKMSHSNLEAALAANDAAKIEQLNQQSYVKQLEVEQQTLKTKLNQLLSELEALKAANEELLAMRNESMRVQELEERIGNITSERDLLQLQLNDITRAFDEQRKSTEVSITNLPGQFEASSLEMNQLTKELENLRGLGETPLAVTSIEQELAPESMWEVDEDPWGLSDKTISHSTEQHVNIPVIPSPTIQLQVRIDELEDKLKYLTEEKAKLFEDCKNAQLKNAKYVKKLKEYKLQLDSLQQQLKSQKSIGSFGADLDFTIEEELRAQIKGLGKELAEAREESKKISVEKEALLKRIDVLTAASERFTDAKEKQDTELRIWQMRYKDLEVKLQQLESGSETKETSPASIIKTCSADQVSILEEEIKELKDNMEALAADNEKLQQLLEEHTLKKQISIDELHAKTIELTANNDKLTSDYNNLRIQYEQSLTDANDQLQSLRQNCELLERQLEEKKINIDDLTKNLESLKTENKLLTVDYKDLWFSTQQREQEIDRLTKELSTRPEVGHNETEVQALKDSLEGMEESIKNYKMEIQNRTEELKTLRKTISNMEISLAGNEQQVVELQSRLQHQQIQLDLRDEEVQLLQTERDELVRMKQEIKNPEEFMQFNKVTSDTAGGGMDMFKFDDVVNKPVVEKNVMESKPGLLGQNSSHAKEETIKSDELERLRSELTSKNQEINQLKEWINNNTSTELVQEMQDSINTLYNEKSALEELLDAKSQEVEALKSQLEEQHHQLRKRSLEGANELAKLQAELESRDQELLELHQVVSEKEMQLKLALQRGEENADGLGADLIEKQHQLESLKFTVADLQSEVASLRALEGLAADDRAAIERLTSEKEQARREGEEAVERIIQEKMDEINAIKLELEKEKMSLTDALHIRQRDLENLKLQIMESNSERESLLEQRTEQLVKLDSELSERDRRLAELSITKDTEIHNMRVQLGEKNARLDELIAMSEEEEKQLVELRKLLEEREAQIGSFKDQLAEKSKEIELMQHALQRHTSNPEQTSQVMQQQQQLQHSPSEEVRVSSPSTTSTTDELDLALYMLHQRDMRCEELTRELMQLLEERDTLQLRLSNAIRVNEELRKLKTGSVVSSPKRNSSSTEVSVENTEPHVRDLSPSNSEGPIEIAREAINSSIGEDKKALAQKLLQLKSVDQGRDVRLRDERELRHAQQMSLLAHGDVLSTLPPEAAARLVNANYTLSRDVQSQSSVLMNWLWGKSTPKIVHM